MSESTQGHLVRLFSEWLREGSDRTSLHFFRTNRQIFCRLELNGTPEEVLGRWGGPDPETLTDESPPEEGAWGL